MRLDIDKVKKKHYNGIKFLSLKRKSMKLNYKRTILVGFAFFLICAFWQAYDTLVPLMLDRFGLNQTASGAIMAVDNVLAVFLLPLFGALSDRTNTRFGKRKPYIIIGTIIAIVTFFALTFTENMHLALLQGNSEYATLSALGKEATDDQKKQMLAIAWEITKSNPLPFIIFGILLFITLLAMSIFRSPAVALMPDVTVKPLRSKANAVINLLGAVGGIIVLGLGIVFGTGSKPFLSYTGIIGVVCLVMLIALFIFVFAVKENEWSKQMVEDSLKNKIEEDKEQDNESRKLSGRELISLILILASVALWYMGYNAVTSRYSVYAKNILFKDYNLTLIIAQASAIISYIPVGILTSKFGRKKMILLGVIMLSASFGAASFITADSPSIIITIFFALAGIGWATINVNSFPMVVELSKNSNIGKYTGYYYTASMLAQVVTPILSGVFYDNVGARTLFPYATIFCVLSFITMLFVKHGDSKPMPKKGLEALDVDND